MAIKLVIADDHEVIRQGLSEIFSGSDIQVVAKVKNGAEAVRAISKHSPDVLLMDVMMGDSDGLPALEKIRSKSTKVKVVMMSGHDNPTYIARSIALGGDGYVLKDASADEFIESIKRAYKGEGPADGSWPAEIRETLAKRTDPVLDEVPLTKREYQVLRHLAFGLSNREIGRSLSISIETVKEHVQNILRKLDAADRTEAAVWAVKRNLA